MTAKIAQVGVRGYGQTHLERIAAAQQAGRVELIAYADPAGPLAQTPGNWYPNITELLAAEDVDIVSVATPINTHLDIALAAMDAGCDVMLEKPPVASLADFWWLLHRQQATGVRVQVGFQSLGSQAIARLRQLYLDQTLGEGTRLVGRGLWLRRKAYFKRSSWAGKRTMNGQLVADGVCTNQLAHALATMFKIAGVVDINQIVSVTTELYHANQIEADDTSLITVQLEHGERLSAGLTVCASEELPATVELHGSRGSAVLRYTEDELDLTIDGQHTHETFQRVDPLTNLLDARDGLAELNCSLSATVAFMAVLEATQQRSEPWPISGDFIDWRDSDDQAHPVVQDVESWIDRAIRSGEGFDAVGAPWADEQAIAVWWPSVELAELRVDGVQVAAYSDGSDMIELSSPRPYLHPIQTLGGVRISDAHPADHDWHCGLSFTMQDVNGVNFWGGPSYVSDHGYQWLGDQGRIEHVEMVEQSEDHLTQILQWTGPHVGHVVDAVDLTERRALHWRRIAELDAWLLDADIELSANSPEEILLGGPGTNGREGAGYGGWQLRLSPNEVQRIWDADGREGVDAVHGSTARWVAWTGEFMHQTATVVMARVNLDDADRWFVRQHEYPGLGSAIAWQDPVALPLKRGYQLIVADGSLSSEQINAALS